MVRRLGSDRLREVHLVGGDSKMKSRPTIMASVKNSLFVLPDDMDSEVSKKMKKLPWLSEKARTLQGMQQNATARLFVHVCA